MNYSIKRFLLGFASAILVAGAWLWMTAIEYEEEQQEVPYVVPDRFKPKQPEPEPEPEPDYVYKEAPPPHYGWVYPPKQVRKAAGKIKKKIKPKKQ